MDLKKHIPKSWKLSHQRLAERLMKMAYMEGKIYQKRECINHMIKEGNNANS